jgi:hypothetical protein
MTLKIAHLLFNRCENLWSFVVSLIRLCLYQESVSFIYSSDIFNQFTEKNINNLLVIALSK